MSIVPAPSRRAAAAGATALTVAGLAASLLTASPASALPAASAGRALPAASATRQATAPSALSLSALGRLAPAAIRQKQASPTAAHDALGRVYKVTATATGLLATGWAGDPDADGANTTVEALLDGRTVLGSVTTSIAMPTVTKAHPVGATPGFSLPVTLPAGVHTVCFVAMNVGPGLDKVMSCVVTPLGTHLSAAQRALHDPVGLVQTATATNSTMTVSGWTSDPDDLDRSSVVVLYVDGAPAGTTETRYHALPRPVGAGRRSAFAFHVPVSSGSHMACVWTVNVGLGANSFLGCDAVGTAAHQAAAPQAPATIGAAVVKQAKKHIGQRYVWGAVGPKTFDCSGLVMYSYRKNGFTTPRIAADQFAAAKVIPASDAQPGDLVFYHDDEGNVYHVGIYLAPGRTVAAIDTQEGVNYQPIWDPSTASFGTFDHS